MTANCVTDEVLDTTAAWLNERLDNCRRIANSKRGEDRTGWLDDAEYFTSAISALAELKERRAANKPSDQTTKPRYEWIAEQMAENGMVTQAEEVRRMGKELASRAAEKRGRNLIAG